MRIEQVLSERLLAVTKLVTKGNRVADIGCDHAYTSIYLVEKEIAPYAVAMDINAGPIERAKENVTQYGLTEKICVRRSDGVKELAPEEADTLLITGMGGLLMKKILSDKPEVTAAAKELVLQPQSEVEELRRFLHSIGYAITAEQMCRDEGKFYVMFRAEKAKTESPVPADREVENKLQNGENSVWTDLEYRYGAHLLKERPAVFLDYLRYELTQKEDILAELSGIETEKVQVRKEQLTKEAEELRCLLA